MRAILSVVASPPVLVNRRKGKTSLPELNNQLALVLLLYSKGGGREIKSSKPFFGYIGSSKPTYYVKSCLKRKKISKLKIRSFVCK